ncbi:MAG: tail fiber domain-containing protein [Bacteroidota bacterium]
MPTEIDNGSYGYKFSWRNDDGTARQDALIFDKTGSSYLTGGNIGIGTTSPNAKLDVVDTKNDNYVYTIITNNGSGGAGLWLNNLNSSSGSSKVIFRNSNVAFNGPEYWALGNDRTDGNKFKISASTDMEGSSSFVFDRSGNLGLGTSSPSAKLDIESVAFDITRLKRTSGGGASLLFENSSAKEGRIGLDANDRLFMQSPDDLYLQAAGATRLFIANNGNVGIGTTNPNVNTKLDVFGDLALSDGTGNIGFYEDNALKAFLSYNGTSLSLETNETNGDVIIDAIDDVFLRAGSSTRILIEDDGDVGIGTLSPQVSLHVRQSQTPTVNKALPQSAVTNVDGIRIQDVDNSDWTLFVDGANDLNFSFNNSLRSWIEDLNGTYVTSSDRRLKTNIRELDSVLENVLQLRPTTYQYKDAAKAKPTIGFIAQEVEGVMPELVVEKEGIKALPYDYFGVIAIKAIQELHEKVVQKEETIEVLTDELDAIKARNTALETRLAKIEALLSGKVELNTIKAAITDASLEQNAPNPFSEATTISYFIPENVKSASLQVLDQNGRIIKSVPIQATGEGQITLQANLLSAGTYSYSLVLDGQVMATKQMVLTH